MGEALSSEQPIGIFDSGIGGLTVANAIVKYLPYEHIVYFGDTAHLPYGDKSPDSIRYYCLKIAKFLLEKNCKMIVVACNSASSAGYHILLEFFQRQALFVNVVDPLVEEVTRLRSVQKVGIIATKATIGSRIYQHKLAEQQPEWEVKALPTPLLAPMIEEGFLGNRISAAILDTYLNDPSLKDIDALLLACTHYPLIRPAIEKWYHKPIAILDNTDVVARAVQQKLQAKGLLNTGDQPGTQAFFVSDFTASFQEATRLFFGRTVKLEAVQIW